MKNRYFLFFFFLALICLVGLFINCLHDKQTTQPAGKSITETQEAELSVSTDVCGQFPRAWVAETLKKEIVMTERHDSNVTHSCQYYVTASAFITLRLNALNVEEQKKGQTALGRTLTTNASIPIPHAVVLQDNGLINEILLVLGPDLFVTVDRSSSSAATDSELVAFAAKVAERIRTGGTTGTKPSAQPITETVHLPREADIISSFFSLISEHRASDAVGMMSAKAIPDDSTRQGWAVQFNAFDSLKIISMEPSMQDSWTETTHSYKVVLDVKMKPDAVNAQPIPNYGWDDGRNTRWVSLSKIGARWMIDGLATGP